MNPILDQIGPETLLLIEKQAALFGLSIDDFLRSLLPVAAPPSAPPSSDHEFEADMTAFAEGPEAPAPYDGTYSREDIYFDHD